MYKMVDKLIGNYRIKSLIGRGAFSEVYLAHHIVLTNRAVAIKFLSPSFDKKRQEQFIQEAYVLERLRQPHILPIYDVGFYDNYTYLVAEYASGGSLRDYIQRLSPGRVPVERVVRIILQVSQALEEAHKQNIIHRDVKPENILFNSSGDAFLADFGIAIMLDPEASEARLDMTGTPAYMSPEQLSGDVSKASDQYALGCVAYELLTGQMPFQADSVLEIFRKQKQEMPILPRQLAPGILPAVEEVILKSLAKDRNQRFEDIASFAIALEQAADGVSPFLLNSTLKSFSEQESHQTASSTVLFRSSIEESKDLKDFFVTYHEEDRFWAEWIAWNLEGVGYSTILPAWDFRVGTDLNLEIRKAMAKAKRIITVLSPRYFSMRRNLEEWSIAFQENGMSASDRLFPILVSKCEQRHMKLLKSTVYIDLVDCDEASARQILLAKVSGERIKPSSPPAFPGNRQRKNTIDKQPPFPAMGNTHDRIRFSQQILPEIRSAFAREDWSEVLRKTSSLLQPQATDTLSSDLYHLHGLALFHVGEVEKAKFTLETALTLELDDAKQIPLLEDYINILVALGRWEEVLYRVNIVLQRFPNTLHWQAIQRQALMQVNDATIIRPKEQMQPGDITVIRQKKPDFVSTTQGIEVFFSYSHKDETLRSELEKYFSNLKRSRVIVGWHDGEIEAGRDWDQEIKVHLNRAHIILLLVSQDFIASDYCFEGEMMRALERHANGEAFVVPIILRPAHWEDTPLGKLQVLPTGARPITRWDDRDEAFLDVLKGIQKTIDKWIKTHFIGTTDNGAP